MGAIKDTYDIAKDIAKGLINFAKKANDLEMRQTAMDLQDKIDELKDIGETLENENKLLKDEINRLLNPVIKEEDLDFNRYGYITKKTDNSGIRYCGNCYSKLKKLIPLAKQHDSKGTSQYKCGDCGQIYTYRF